MKFTKKIPILLLAIIAALSLAACGGNAAESQASTPPAEVKEVSADEALVGVTAIGFVDVDGTKASAIAVEYNVELAGAAVNKDTYEVDVFTPDANDYIVNYENIGAVADVYVNSEPAVSENGGSGEGNYVIIELNTDYVRTSEPSYTKALAVGVTQVAEIRGAGSAVTPGTAEVVNYTSGVEQTRDGEVAVNLANPGTYTITGLDQYKIFATSADEGNFPSDGEAYIEKACFNEKSGETYDYELGYALWVPEDYDPSGNYALVTVDHTITGNPSPYEALLTNYGPTYFISDEAQQIVKDEHGLDGMIVVVPLVIERVDDNSCLPAMWMALVGLWDHLQEEYSIDPDHVYGAGQSMGGMLLMQTNTNRDNYFAGMLCYGNQWGQNYYKDTVFARGMSAEGYEETPENTPRHYPSTADSYYIWDYHYDENGEKVYEGHDSYNFYYLISDDNLMVFNGSTNGLSMGLWGEMSSLYTDLAGYSIPHLTYLDGLTAVEDQDAAVESFLAAGNSCGDTEMGLWECTWEGNGNDGTAIWSRRLHAGYEWLLSQSRESEIKRAKFDINRTFELADEQLQDETHMLAGFVDKETGEQLYYPTAKVGSGTRFYNSSCLPLGAAPVPADLNPGWLPEGMSWEVGVEPATIVGVEAITDASGKLTAFAVEYDVDMENLFIHIIGDKVIASDGTLREGDLVKIDPYDFYDAAGNQVTCTITNVYVNNTAAVKANMERNSGSGNYVIVEVESASDADTSSVGVVQRTTVITDTAISSATSKMYK